MVDAAGESCVCGRSQARDGRVDGRTAIGMREVEDITRATAAVQALRLLQRREPEPRARDLKREQVDHLIATIRPQTEERTRYPHRGNRTETM